jgi:hypothetical protein
MREELRASLGSFITLWNALAEWVTADTRACVQQLRSPPVVKAAAADTAVQVRRAHLADSLACLCDAFSSTAL